ncbi:MAG: hypothetical protein HYY61_02310 [Deltaproteobacteria bacterium]|nr:hypothetical protein [Deltaproteobacteria bacterium]
MKNTLKILVVISAIVTLPLSLKAQHEQSHTDTSGVSIDAQGNVSYNLPIDDPRAQEAIRQGEERRSRHEEEVRARRNAEASGYKGYFGQETWNAGEAGNGTFTTGHIDLDPEYVKSQKQNMMSDGMQQMGAISQSASTLTKSPKTAGVIMATASGLGGAGTLINAASYGNLAGQYSAVQSKNLEAIEDNKSNIADMEASLAKLKKDPKNRIPSNLIRKIEDAKAELKSQENAAKRAGSNKWGNYMGMGASLLGSAAMFTMGAFQYENNRKLDNEMKACRQDPTKCVGYVPPRPERDNRPLPIPPDLRPTGPEGFDPNRLPKPAQASVISKDGANAARGNSGSRSGHSPDFLSSSGLSARGASPMGEKSESDFGGGYSDDQSFGSASGGSASGRESAGSYVSNGGSPSGNENTNFDISQFIPSWMKDQQVPTDENGFLIASMQAPQTKKETKGLLLGKNSPSLFTRVSQAYQKKAHELKEEVL